MRSETQGEGRDVVVIPGSPQPAADLAGVAAILARSFRVTSIDPPGYGGSAPVAGPYDIAAVGAELVAALGRAGVREPVLVGMSAGSYRSLQIALDHPALGVRGLALLGPLASVAPAHGDGLRELAAAFEAGADLTDAAFAQFFSPAFVAAQPARCRDIVSRMLASAPRAAIAAELRAFAAAPDLLPRLEAVRVPVYLRVGELDQATPVAYAEAIAAALPDARLDVVPGQGHLLHHEDLEGTSAALAAFLSRVHGASA